MNTKQRLSMLLLGAASIGLSSADASAGNCDVEFRAIPASGFDQITMTCSRGTVQATTGTVGAVAGVEVDGTPFKSLFATLTSGKAGSGAFASATGLTSAGVPIAGCTAQDFTFGGANSAVDCPSAVRWQGTIFFPES